MMLCCPTCTVGKLDEAKKVLQDAINTLEKSVTAQNGYCKVQISYSIHVCIHVDVDMMCRLTLCL